MTDLQPGPELDAAVAEKVLGWEQADSEEFYIDRSHGLHLKRYTGPKYDWFDEVGDEMPSDQRPIMSALPFRPSTRIQDAWEVVERMREYGKHGCAVELETTVLDGGADDGEIGWHCCLIQRGHGNHRGTAPTAPHAICLAALKAVEETA